MSPAKRSLVIGGICLTGSSAMVFHASYSGSQGLFGLCFNGIFLILVWLFYRWAYLRIYSKPELTDAQKLARGLDMTDIKEELNKCPPRNHTSMNP